MPGNPYHFTGPLDPIEHSSTCIFRAKEAGKVINGLLDGDYWVILGPRQIGKTTFLRQVKHELAVHPGIYIDLESSPAEDEAFYGSMIDALVECTGEKTGPPRGKSKDSDFDHKTHFYHFLKTFNPVRDKKIIFFFDEIEKAPSIHSFLNMWRKVFHERMDHPGLKKYALVIAGSVDLIPLTIGPTSPFNIARKMYLPNLSAEESGLLIDRPLKELGVTIEPGAREQLLAKTSGHPQLLQHLCHTLVERAREEHRGIAAPDVTRAIEEILFIESDNLKTLDQQIKADQSLRELTRRLLNREKIRYAPYQHFTLTGVGPIVSEENHCAFRCNLYGEFLGQMLEFPWYHSPAAAPTPPEDLPTPGKTGLPGVPGEILYHTVIYFHEPPPDLSSKEKEECFLKALLFSKSLTVEIEKTGKEKKEIHLQGKEKLIFCYLAYKNYKALKQDGFKDWQDIPDSYRYRLSSNPQNNEEHQQEWQIFIKYFEEIREKKPVDQDIRQWKYALQQTLEPIEMADIIDTKKSGRGGGYLLKGTVEYLAIK